MKPRAFTRRLLVVLALFGLVLAPLTASSASLTMSAQAMASMPDGMPCCPDDQPAVPDCGKDCPLAVLCLSGLVSVPVPETLRLLTHLPIGDKFLVGREAVLSSLGGEPPPRPPKA
ncbi:hypothetical protein DY251_16160 [Mesorhizobium denitrificans]|uniref:DUF2946 domain-containing protein n=1 Tax=Mesorhizobium denitrificans TaxID=2294114 RepID=A0A371X9N7_9HYPH|nr:hypothetical protein DY251_16160 [Mesorhizobium denitrificans]